MVVKLQEEKSHLRMYSFLTLKSTKFVFLSFHQDVLLCGVYARREAVSDNIDQARRIFDMALLSIGGLPLVGFIRFHLVLILCTLLLVEKHILACQVNCFTKLLLIFILGLSIMSPAGARCYLGFTFLLAITLKHISWSFISISNRHMDITTFIFCLELILCCKV